MTAWQAFFYQGTTYDLSHLDSFDHVFVQAATAEKPERHSRVRVHFGHHCFTESPKAGTTRLCFLDTNAKQADSGR